MKSLHFSHLLLSHLRNLLLRDGHSNFAMKFQEFSTRFCDGIQQVSCQNWQRKKMGSVALPPENTFRSILSRPLEKNMIIMFFNGSYNQHEYGVNTVEE